MPEATELVECAFLVPLVRNGDRAPHQPAAWNALQDALFEMANEADGYLL